jgi:protein-L-isoaspartate(D-aspartate) O-methyltransferase
MDSSKKDNLIETLIKEGYLKTPRIIDAFKKIDRFDFVIDYLKTEAYHNVPLGIGFGQTISQPLTVAVMMELLQPQAGQKILDVGSGSGWSTALLCEIVGEKGKVYGVEIVPELSDFGKKNVSHYNFVSKGIAEFICSDGSKGLPEKALFDGIISAAGSHHIPEAWKKQLKIGGRLVLPMNQSLWLIIKKSENDFEFKEYPGFIFVPLIERD